MGRERVAVVMIALVVIVVAVASLVPIISNPKDSKDGSLDVIVIAGQSNAEYTEERCDISLFNELYSEEPVKNLYFCGIDGDTPVNYWNTNGLDMTSGGFSICSMWDDNWVIGGYEPILANDLAKKTGNDILVINTGVGGKKISELIPGSVFGDYGFRLINTAISKVSSSYSTINFDYWVWIQGEADYNTDIDQYIDDFKLLQNEFKKYECEHCVIVNTRETWGGNANVAQGKISECDSNVDLVAKINESFSLEEGGHLLDEPGAYGIHYSCKGRVVIANDIVSVIV